jgi:Polysaccharide biosynthesis enzyme WcbI
MSAVVGAAHIATSRQMRVVVVGNCQAEIVCRELRHPGLENRFAPIYQFVNLEESRHAQGRRELAECDLLLVQDIGNMEDYPLLADIPDRLDVIRFPCLRLASLWPFDGNNGPTDREAALREQQEPRFAYLDGLLARLRKRIPDKEERFNAYRSLDSGPVVNFRRLHEFEERRLTAMDRKFECSIGSFILDNFRTSRLFHATDRPNARLWSMLMRLIVKRLGSRSGYPENPDHDPLQAAQVPVHPKVAGGLEVKWVNPETRYVFGERMVTWETYIREYIDHFG